MLPPSKYDLSDRLQRIPVARWQRINGAPEDDPVFRAKDSRYEFELRRTEGNVRVDVSDILEQRFIGAYTLEVAQGHYARIEQCTRPAEQPL